jgi:hypothetical protein
MSPKEKAEKLVLRFMYLQEPNYNWFHKGLGKQCALIAVDEMIEETDTYYDTLIASERKLFLEEVKQEIEKL